MTKIEDQFRFDIMDFGDEIESAYICRLKEEEKERQLEIEKAEQRVKAEVAKLKEEVEKKGVCEYCGSDKMPRWVNKGDCYGADGTYQCYECFRNNLQCWADVIVPPHNLYQMHGYMPEWEWNELWKSEQKMKIYIKKMWCDRCKSDTTHYLPSFESTYYICRYCGLINYNKSKDE